MNNDYSKSFLRNEMGAYMAMLGEKSEKVVVINADLSGTCRNKEFVEKYPDRSFNTGIAEQNMVSFAAGLAHEGFIPYVFSMAPFLTMRACEQCRTDVAYAGLPVRMMGVYAGISGGISGATHWAIEDCGIMTSIPNIQVLEPCDVNQAKQMLDASIDYEGPIYIRSSVEAVRDIYPDDFDFQFGGSSEVVAGNDATILCSGVLVQYAIQASEILKRDLGINVRVVDMYSIKPIDSEAVVSALKTGNVLVAQDHNIFGGLGTMVAMIAAESGIAAKFKIIGIPDKFVAMAHAEYLYKKFGMDGNGLAKSMKTLMDI